MFLLCLYSSSDSSQPLEFRGRQLNLKEERAHRRLMTSYLPDKPEEIDRDAHNVDDDDEYEYVDEEEGELDGDEYEYVYEDDYEEDAEVEQV